MPITALLLLAIFVSAGCLSNGDDGEGTPSITVEAPEWSLGQWWDYGYINPNGQNLGFKLIVADDDGVNYLVGVEELSAAQYHAVLNFNPVLGRVDMNNFSIFEKGEPQLLLDFPLKKGKEWSFSLLDVDRFNARVTKIEQANLPVFGKTTLTYVEATGSGSEQLSYIFDVKAGWLYYFNFSDAGGNPSVVLNLNGYGTGYSGQVHFIRATDLYDREFVTTGTVTDGTNNGAPGAEDFADYITYLEYTTGEDSSASLSFRDDEGDEVYRRDYSSNSEGQNLNAMPVDSGDWTLSVTLEGDSYLRFRIAGGILTTWTL